jgi:hypothetical protein
MAHFAKVEDGIVTQVIVAEQEFINSGAVGNPENWIQTSYNTYGGVHLLGGTPLRKNFAGIGFSYNTEIDAFIPPKPLEYESWVLNEEKCIWEPPVERPDDGNLYYWNEELLEWALLDESLINP